MLSFSLSAYIEGFFSLSWVNGNAAYSFSAPLETCVKTNMLNFDFCYMKGVRINLPNISRPTQFWVMLHRFACACTMPIKGFWLVKACTTGW